EPTSLPLIDLTGPGDNRLHGSNKEAAASLGFSGGAVPSGARELARLREDSTGAGRHHTREKAPTAGSHVRSLTNRDGASIDRRPRVGGRRLRDGGRGSRGPPRCEAARGAIPDPDRDRGRGVGSQ